VPPLPVDHASHAWDHSTSLLPISWTPKRKSVRTVLWFASNLFWPHYQEAVTLISFCFQGSHAGLHMHRVRKCSNVITFLWCLWWIDLKHQGFGCLQPYNSNVDVWLSSSLWSLGVQGKLSEYSHPPHLFNHSIQLYTSMWVYTRLHRWSTS
jgi:hypothetical protein